MCATAWFLTILQQSEFFERKDWSELLWRDAEITTILSNGLILYTNISPIGFEAQLLQGVQFGPALTKWLTMSSGPATILEIHLQSSLNHAGNINNTEEIQTMASSGQTRRNSKYHLSILRS